MRLKLEKQIKVELTRIRRRQNNHIFNNKDHKRKLKLKKILWYNLKLKKSKKPSS